MCMATQAADVKGFKGIEPDAAQLVAFTATGIWISWTSKKLLRASREGKV